VVWVVAWHGSPIRPVEPYLNDKGIEVLDVASIDFHSGAKVTNRNTQFRQLVHVDD
jgi:hypothetical protein